MERNTFQTFKYSRKKLQNYLNQLKQTNILGEYCVALKEARLFMNILEEYYMVIYEESLLLTSKNDRVTLFQLN